MTLPCRARRSPRIVATAAVVLLSPPQPVLASASRSVASPDPTATSPVPPSEPDGPAAASAPAYPPDTVGPAAAEPTPFAAPPAEDPADAPRPEPPREQADTHEHPHGHAHAHERPVAHEHTASGVAPTRNTRVPARMSAMQQAGWWTLLGAFVLTGTAATLGGVAAHEQGRRRRLALLSDPPGDDPMRETAAQPEAEADIARSRERGQGFSVSALVVGSVAGAAALAGVIVLVVDVAKRRPSSDRRARVGLTGIEVRF